MNNISILIVEDEAVTAMFMETMLKKRGYKILKCVSSGEEAVLASLELKPDIVLMDIRLAGKMDGIEAAWGIKTGMNGSLGIVFVTGYSDQELKEKAFLLSPLAFFVKPVDMSELVRVIESYSLTNNNQE